MYDNVSTYSPSICGTYININDFQNGLAHTVEFEINLPFDNILALQAFDLFPNFCWGNIEFKFYVKSRGLVWCALNPSNVKDYKEVMEGEEIDIDLSDTNLAALYRHAFIQINNSATIINNGTFDIILTVGSSSALLQCTVMSIQQLKSNMYGFGISAKSAQKVNEVYKIPQVIPSQILDYNAFPLSATRSGIQSTINMPITNCTFISIMFPKNDNDDTVFENPVYNNVQ